MNDALVLWIQVLCYNAVQGDCLCALWSCLKALKSKFSVVIYLYVSLKQRNGKALTACEVRLVNDEISETQPLNFLPASSKPIPFCSASITLSSASTIFWTMGMTCSANSFGHTTTPFKSPIM